jgi:hypothetical protein
MAILRKVGVRPVAQDGDGTDLIAFPPRVIANGVRNRGLTNAHLEMVDFGFWQGRIRLAPTGVARLRRGPTEGENAVRGQKMPFLDGHWAYRPVNDTQ